MKRNRTKQETFLIRINNGGNAKYRYNGINSFGVSNRFNIQKLIQDDAKMLCVDLQKSNLPWVSC